MQIDSTELRDTLAEAASAGSSSEGAASTDINRRIGRLRPMHLQSVWHGGCVGLLTCGNIPSALAKRQGLLTCPFG